MNIIRKYKLHILKYDSLTKKEVDDLNIIFKFVKYCKENFDLINFIYNNILNLKQVSLKYYSISNFYFKDDKYIFQHDLKSDYLYINNDLIWVVFKNKFNYNYQEICDLIKRIVEEAYKLRNIIPQKLHWSP